MPRVGGIFLSANRSVPAHCMRCCPMLSLLSPATVSICSSQSSVAAHWLMYSLSEALAAVACSTLHAAPR